MNRLKLPLAGSSAQIVLSSDSTRQRVIYEDGKPTTKQATFDNGKPVYVTEGMVAINGKKLGNVRIESPVADIPDVPMNTLFIGKGEGYLQVTPQDNFNIRVTLSLPDGFEVEK